MILNAKLNSKDKPVKSSAKKAKNSGKKQSSEVKVLEDKAISKKKEIIDAFMDTKSVSLDLNDAPDEYLGNELYTLRYDINERGIGKILLPPSLSTLLQSDRVCISPTAGGLFIKSL